MNYEQMNNNQVQLQGTILTNPVFSHEVLGEGFYELLISVKRLSMQEDVIPITVSERIIGEKRLEIGNTISLLGQFRSYNKTDGEKSRLILTTFVREFIENEDCNNSNNIDLVGYICKNPIFRTTPFKREICDVLIAVNRAYNKSDYIPCILWGRNARYVQNLPVGEKLNINGRIQSRKYLKNINGISEEKTAYEVSVGRVIAENRMNDILNNAS